MPIDREQRIISEIQACELLDIPMDPDNCCVACHEGDYVDEFRFDRKGPDPCAFQMPDGSIAEVCCIVLTKIEEKFGADF